MTREDMEKTVQPEDVMEPDTAETENPEAEAPEADSTPQDAPEAESGAQKENGTGGEAGEEETPDADADPSEKEDEDVVDGDFRQVEEKAGKGAKGSFFRKKKDKKDERIEELSDQLKRQMAEFDNFRKRTEREKSQMFDQGARSVIEKLLPTVDNFERGLASAGENSEDPFVQGMEKIYRQLLQELENIGVTPIEAEGKEFDPAFHNAVMHCEDDSVGENIIVQELQKGYMYHDTVVRHSMVKVAN